MSVANTGKRRQARDIDTISPKRHGRQRNLLAIGIGVAVIGMAAFFIIWGGSMKDKMGMQDYLKDKYGQEFNIKDIRTRDAGIGMPGLRVGTAHPVGDDSLTFEVGKSRSTGKYFDGYSGAVWAREERPQVQSFLETVYDPSDAPNFDLRTHIPTTTEPDPIRGKVPSIDSAMSQYKDNFYYDVSVMLSVDGELSSQEIENHTEKIKRIIDFVLSKGVSHPGVRYAINIEGRDESYLCNISKDKLTDSQIVGSCLTKKSGKAW